MTRKSATRHKTGRRRDSSKGRLPSLALCVIARDEERFIAKCLDSARPFVDEIVLLDTGSTDATREIARAHGARVEEFAWCDDFAAARNAAIEAATADWILMLDADEQLEPTSGPLLRKLATELPAGMIAFAISIENRRLTDEESIFHAVNRFFPRSPDVRYQGSIHEDLCYLPDPAGSTAYMAPSIRVIHYGYDPAVYAAKAKDERNMRLLELEIERHPENIRMLYHLGQQHFVASRHRAAADAFARFIEHAARLAPYYRVDAYRLWIESLTTLGDEDQLNRIAQQAEAGNALSALAREMLALHDLRNGRLASAKRHLRCALDPGAPMGIATPPGAGGWRTRLLLAETYERLGERESALSELQAAFAELPQRLQYTVARQAAQLTWIMQRYAETDRWLRHATRAVPSDLETHQALLNMVLEALRRDAEMVGADVAGPLERALAAEDWQAAYDTLMALPLGTPAALARVLFLAGRLREQRAPEAALDVLERAIDVYEPSGQLYWPLLQTLKDLDRFEDAQAAIDVLRQLQGSEEPLRAAA
jgi:tetratricopeptide (TPR) repeat protein